METASNNLETAGTLARGPLSIGQWMLFACGGLVLLTGIQLFYIYVYSVHTDLAGAALSGRLAVELGSAFADYSLYFPPAERVWFSIAALISQLTGLQLDLIVIAMSTLALLFSTGLAFDIRRRTVGASPWFLVISLAVLVVLPVLYKNVFGLREHLVVLGLWPYLILRLSDPEGAIIGRKTRVVIGLWLGTTLLMKYLYSLVVLLVEMADAIIQRRPANLFRVENLLSGGIVALYLLFWLVLDPAQREVMAAIVGAIDANLADRWLSLQQAAIHGALAAFFVVLSFISKQPLRVTAIGLALVVGAIVASWIQARWYSHHLFPITLAYVAWLWMIRRKTKLLFLVAIGLIIARPVLGEFNNSAIYQVTVTELDEAMTNADLSLEGKRVGLLTMHPSPFNQHLASHGAIRWNASMNNSYVATLLKPLDRPENEGVMAPPVALNDPGVELLHGELLHLWEDQPPDILILNHSTSWPLQFLDVRWKEVFANDVRFQAILEGYDPVFEHEGEWLEFTYYERKE